jgi:predicted ATPase
MSKYIIKLSKRDINSFPNYISQLRLPLYKKIKPDTKISFSFPLTVFVGPNGCGKTSVLQALYGCPHGKNTADYWFSTTVDPIDEAEGKGVNRYIYQYKPSGLGKSVEVMKIRRKRAVKIDEWETARPSRRDGMLSMDQPIAKKEKMHRSLTRWNAVNKEVVYVDFKAELSAFDKFFNFGSFTPRKYIKSKQDFLRHRSEPLKFAFNTGNSSYTYHSRKITCNELLSSNELMWVSKILGKNYSEARIVVHDFFDAKGISILFKEGGNQYSEAVAGSGEVAVVSCVRQVLAASNGALILLDEPEVSLHPGAQFELREMLLCQIQNNAIQVVITTHSPSFVENLPRGAIKVFHRSPDGDYAVINDASPEQAFIRIGSTIAKSKIIYVEDDLAKLLIEKAIREIDDVLLKTYSVKVYPGGGPQIKKDLLVNFAVAESKNIFVFLDGDQKLHQSELSASSIAPASHEELNVIVSNHIGVKLDLPLNGGNADNSEQKKDLLLKVLDKYSECFFFGNTLTPEELIWNSCEKTVDDLLPFATVKGFKEKFVKYSQSLFGSSVNANDIYNAQRILVNKIAKDEPLWCGFVSIVEEMVDFRN